MSQKYAFCGSTVAHLAHTYDGYNVNGEIVNYTCPGDVIYDHPRVLPLPPSTEPEAYTTKHGTFDQGRLFDPKGIPDERLGRADELAAWWMEQSAGEVANLVPKAISYGSVDLDLMGDAMLLLMPHLVGKVDKQELAIAFYLLGKVSRIVGALEQGVAPSRDSWEDASIYARMALRVREAGNW